MDPHSMPSWAYLWARACVWVSRSCNSIPPPHTHTPYPHPRHSCTVESHFPPFPRPDFPCSSFPVSRAPLLVGPSQPNWCRRFLLMLGKRLSKGSVAGVTKRPGIGDANIPVGRETGRGVRGGGNQNCETARHFPRPVSHTPTTPETRESCDPAVETPLVSVKT